MATAADILQQLAQAGAAATDLQAGGASVQIKTNYGPPITVYTATPTNAPPSLISQAIGLQGGVRVLDASGNVVAQYGAWPDTDPVRVGVAVGVLALAAYGLTRLLGRRR